MATKKKALPVDEVEVSVPLVPDKTWSFKHNDERVTFEQWKQINEDHKKWTLEQEKAADAAYEVETKKRKKK